MNKYKFAEQWEMFTSFYDRESIISLDDLFIKSSVSFADNSFFFSTFSKFNKINSPENKNSSLLHYHTFTHCFPRGNITYMDRSTGLSTISSDVILGDSNKFIYDGNLDMSISQGYKRRDFETQMQLNLKGKDNRSLYLLGIKNWDVYNKLLPGSIFFGTSNGLLENLTKYFILNTYFDFNLNTKHIENMKFLVKVGNNSNYTGVLTVNCDRNISKINNDIEENKINSNENKNDVKFNKKYQISNNVDVNLKYLRDVKLSGLGPKNNFNEFKIGGEFTYLFHKGEREASLLFKKTFDNVDFTGILSTRKTLTTSISSRNKDILFKFNSKFSKNSEPLFGINLELDRL